MGSVHGRMASAASRPTIIREAGGFPHALGLFDLALAVPGGAPASIPQPDYSNLRVSSRLFFSAFFIKNGRPCLIKIHLFQIRLIFIIISRKKAHYYFVGLVSHH